MFFQFAQLVTDGALGDTQFRRSFCDREVAGNRI